MVQKAIVDTRYTSTMFQKNLSILDAYISSINSNVNKFNEYVKLNYEGLLYQRERCNNLMANLFVGYRAYSHRKFVQ